MSRLLEVDQLTAVRTSGEAFSELEERPPPFPPTFKYKVGVVKKVQNQDGEFLSDDGLFSSSFFKCVIQIWNTPLDPQSC